MYSIHGKLLIWSWFSKRETSANSNFPPVGLNIRWHTISRQSLSSSAITKIIGPLHRWKSRVEWGYLSKYLSRKKIMRIIITNLAGTVLRILEGSVLGPLIYIIYIKDLDTLASSDVSNFADGIKVSWVIKSDKDANVIQDELGRLYNLAWGSGI